MSGGFGVHAAQYADAIAPYALIAAILGLRSIISRLAQLVRDTVFRPGSEMTGPFAQRSHVSGLKDGVPLCGNPDAFFGVGMVAFLDLLGFSQTVLNDWGDTDTSPLARLLRIKDRVRLEGASEQISGGDYSDGPDGKAVWHSQWLVKTHTLSDSVTLSIALPQNVDALQLGVSFTTLFLNLMLAWRAAVDEGFVLRGAIELGDIHWSQSEIMGPALIRAYNLEKYQSKTARIVVGPRLLKTLASLNRRGSYDWGEHLYKSHDGLLASLPTYIIEPGDPQSRLRSIRKLRDQAGSDLQEKYTELLRLLDGGAYQHPTPDEMDACAAHLESLMP